jgi:GNAT superfamily N-acetyltransferase/extradiol dioxygenase family protein
MTTPILRVARPTDNLPALRRFYCDGLGLQQLSSFTAHNGFDGLMLGHPQAPYHLEFTHQPGHTVGRAPTADNLLVFYLPDAAEWQAAVQRMEAAGFAPVPAYNPYWDAQGRTFEDPDGYRVVLQQAAWAPQAAAPVTLRDFRSGDQPVFRQLNEEWISHYFTLEPADLKALDHPEEYILEPGGCILLAEVGGQVVGTCALIKMPDGRSYELAKMAVSPAAQGQQIGYLLGQAAVQRVRDLGGARVYLESNSKLAPALALYRKLGFQDLAEPNPSPYARADVQMELLLA